MNHDTAGEAGDPTATTTAYRRLNSSGAVILDTVTPAGRETRVLDSAGLLLATGTWTGGSVSWVDVARP